MQLPAASAAANGRVLRIFFALVCAALALTFSSYATAQNFLANKKFAPTTIGPNASSQLTFDLFNGSSSTLTSTFADTLPVTTPAGQLWFSAAGAATVVGTGCTTGAVTFSNFLDAPTNARAQTVTVTGATVPNQPIPAQTNPDCRITLPVYSGALAADATLVNSVPLGDATATGTAGSFTSDLFSATLQVRAPVNVVVGKSFSPQTVPAGGGATLTITVRNPSAAFPLTVVSFSDALPSGLTVAAVPTFSGCGGATSTAVATDTTVPVTGATIAAGATCTVTVPVVAPTGGNVMIANTIPAGNVQSNESSTNTSPANASLNVVNSIGMTKAFRDPDNNALNTNDSPTPASFTSGAATALVNQPLAMRIYFSNPTGAPLTAGSLTDLLPNSVVPVGAAVSGTCGGSPTLTQTNIASQIQVTISPITVPAANLTNPSSLGSCYIEIYVKATSAFALTTNSIATSDVTFNGNVNPATATSANLTVTAPGGPGPGDGSYLTVHKQFSRDVAPIGTQSGVGAPLLVQKGEKFWMRVAVWNRLFDNSYTNGTITDVLPLNIQVASPLTVRILQGPPTGNTIANGGCGDGVGGGAIGAVNVTTVAGQDVVTYSGFSVRNGSGANASAQPGCFYAIQLVSAVSGDYINTIPANNVTTAEGATNTTAASARVAVLSDLDSSKFFDPSVISQNGKTRLYFRFSNKSVAAITNLAVTDSLPSSAAFGSLTVASPANIANTCGGTITAVGGSVSIAGGGIPAATGTPAVPGICEFAMDVQHAGGSSSSSQITNSVAANQVSNDQNQSNPLPIQANLSTRPMGISVVKEFIPSNANGGAPVKLRLTFSSTSSPSSQWPQDQISLTDSFPAGMIVAPTPNATTTCRKAGIPGGAPDPASPALSATPADIAAVPGANSFTISGFRFRGTSYAAITAVPDNQCQVEIDVVATTTGNKTNTIPAGAVTTFNGSTNSTPSQATLTVLPNTQLLKSFEPASVSLGQTSALVLVINNVNTSPQVDFGLTDTFPSGMTVAGPATTTCGDGVVTTTSNSLTITGGDVNGNSSCEIRAPVQLAATGPYVNNASNITASSVINTAGVTATVRAITPPTVSKSFAATSIQTGSPSTLTITITNVDTATALTGVQLTDNLPTGVRVFTSPAATTSCGGTFAPVALDTSLTLTGGSIAAGSTCTLTVQVTGDPGTYVNTIPAGGLTSDQGGNVTPATANLEIGGTVSLSTTKSGSATGINGGTATYTVTFSNNTAFAVPVAIADSLGSYSAFAWTCSGTNVACPAASGSGSISATLTMPANSTLTYSVTATLPQTGTSITNTSTIGVAPGNPIYTEPPGQLGDNTASAPTTMTRSSNITITKTDGVTQVTAGLTTNYIVTVTNGGPSAAIGALVRDLPGAGLALQSVACSTATSGAVCPSAAGVTLANLTGSGIAVDLPATGSLAFSVVALINPGVTGSVTNTASVSHPDSNGGTPQTATDTDTVAVVAGLQIAKSDGVTSVVAGTNTTYSISVTNGGPSTINGAVVKDVAGVGLTLLSVTCGSASGGAVCPAPASVTVAALAGAGITINLPVTAAPPGPSIPSGMVFTVVARVDPAQTANVTNTATITEPGGQPIPAVDTDTVTQSADISVTKVAVTPSVAVGTPARFDITVRNAGPSSVTGVVVRDVLPSGLVADSVACVSATGGAVCPNAATVTLALLTGTGVLADLPASSSMTFALVARANANGTFVNVATVSHPADSTPEPSSNSSSATLTVFVPVVPTLDRQSLFLLVLLVIGGFVVSRRSLSTVRRK